ncbi:hypothetical protein DSUL_60184 [Desulfovibrionales bacterium]
MLARSNDVDITFQELNSKADLPSHCPSTHKNALLIYCPDHS